jgi:hypothetical protein
MQKIKDSGEVKKGMPYRGVSFRWELSHLESQTLATN